jgi:hypothetical protein
MPMAKMSLSQVKGTRIQVAQTVVPATSTVWGGRPADVARPPHATGCDGQDPHPILDIKMPVGKEVPQLPLIAAEGSNTLSRPPFFPNMAQGLKDFARFQFGGHHLHQSKPILKSFQLVKAFAFFP